ncbi:MAG: ABC transporter substrate-binding protein [candidate division WOR-3 bacterium]
MYLKLIKIIFIFIVILTTFTCSKKVDVLKVGHVGHDHHSALYVAAMAGQEFKSLYGIWLKEIRPKELYELYDGNKKVVEVELYKAGGGAQMPTMMSQGNFDVGFGGVAAVAFFVDKDSPMKMIAPLHAKGDMLVVKPKLNINSWSEFVDWVKKSKKQVRIGYKDPVAVALIIFQRALQAEGITYTSDKADTKAKVFLINMKGEENLNAGLQSDQIDGYVSNNPWCAIAESKGIGKCVAELNNLPPGIFKDHPCCCIAANQSAIKNQPNDIKKFLELMAVATHYINNNPQKSAEYVAQWIGTTPEVEMISMSTSLYSMEPNQAFLDGMWRWSEEMNSMDKFTDKLKGKSRAEFESLLYDFTLLNSALAHAQKRIK